MKNIPGLFLVGSITYSILDWQLNVSCPVTIKPIKVERNMQPIYFQVCFVLVPDKVKL